jgi:cardiolipin synthase A/B
VHKENPALKNTTCAFINILCAGKTVKIIFDGEECLKEYHRLFEEAKKSIWVCMYMLRFDEATKPLWDVLRRKHAEGIKVEVHYDLIGSLRTVPKLITSPFAKMYVPKLHRLNSRNHAKVFIIDDKVGVVSGRNLTKRYYGEWVDASIITSNSEVLGELKDFKKRLLLKTCKEGNGQVKVTDPIAKQRFVYNFVLEHIVKSKHEIMIMSPYFVIDDAIESLLLAAMERGVQVTVIIPHKPEHRWAVTFNRINFQRIHHKNLKVRRSAKMFHSKLMLFDDTALVGSANFDNRSFKYSLEASVVLDKKHMAQLRAHVDEVGVHSVRYNWIQRAYDRMLFTITKPFMELL